MSRNRPRIGLGRCQRGAVAVEMGLTLPFLMLLLFGVAEFGRAIYHHHIITKAVRDATRYLSRVADPTDAYYQGIATNLALRGSLSGSEPLLVKGGTVSLTFDIGAVDNSASPPPFYGPDSIPVVRAIANYAFDSPLLSAFGLSDGIAMRVSHVERHLGE